jgi:hypothetical protein
MNPEIEELEDLLDAILRGMQEALQSGEVLTEEFQLQVAQEINLLTQEIDQLHSQQQQGAPPQGAPQSGGRQPFQGNPPPTINEAPPSPDAQLLWILAGQQEQPFISYLREYPSPETRALLNNPTELSRVIEFLSAMMPQGEQPWVNGIQHADLNSSNIFGSSYNPQTGQMKVRFQGGAEYEYDGVPANIYRAFSKGNASAKTTGSNQYGAWFEGKNPSLGAAMNQYIKQGRFPYRRLR